DGYRVDDRVDHVGVAHPGDTALGADVRGHALEGHDGDRPGVLGDFGLVGGDHVHDHAAFEHLGHAALDPRGAGERRDGIGAPCAVLGLRDGHGWPTSGSLRVLVLAGQFYVAARAAGLLAAAMAGSEKSGPGETAVLFWRGVRCEIGHALIVSEA